MLLEVDCDVLQTTEVRPQWSVENAVAERKVLLGGVSGVGCGNGAAGEKEGAAAAWRVNRLKLLRRTIVLRDQATWRALARGSMQDCVVGMQGRGGNRRESLTGRGTLCFGACIVCIGGGVSFFAVAGLGFRPILVRSPTPL